MVFYDDDHEKGTDGEVYCSGGCSSPVIKGGTAMYACKKCQCFFHKICAELPREIRHVSHKPHPLTLIQDLSQAPPLTLPDKIRNSNRKCLGRNLPLSGTTTYGCVRCRVFLHKFCLELPPELKHSLLHPKHRLFLDNSTKFKCSACSEGHKGFNYHCLKCDYYLGIPCIFSKATRYDQTKAHILTLHTKNTTYLPAPNVDCFVCGKEQGWHRAFFYCVQCNFYVHVHCALPPTFKSIRHKHPLSLGDSCAEDEENTGEDQLFNCDHCETTRYPVFPVYQCLKKECRFVAHCYCTLLEDNLSIAHKLNIEVDSSIVTIKNPALTGFETVEKYMVEFFKFFKHLKAANDGKERAGEEFFREEEGNIDSSNKDLSLLCSGEAFEEFIKRYEPGERHKSILFGSFNQKIVVEVGEYSIAEDLAPVLKALFTRYGDFSAESVLSPMARVFVFTPLCDAVYGMCNTSKDVDMITENLLFFWWDCLRVVRFAGFKIQFAVDRFRKALHTYFGLIYTEDPAMDELDRDMAMLSQEVEAARNSGCASDHRISPVVTNLSSGECSGETLELQNVREAINSLFFYFLEAGEEVSPELKEIIDDFFDDGKESTSELMAKVENNLEIVSLWDYQILINKIKTFFEQQPPMSTATYDDHDQMIKNGTDREEICCYRCDQLRIVLESPFHECTKCGLIFQGTELSRDCSCIHGDHNLIALQEPSLDISEERIYYYRRGCCSLCGLPLWGTTYYCKKHNTSFHKSCVQFPLAIQHRLHPQHPLSLVWNSKRDPFYFGRYRGVTCSACGEECRGRYFTCRSCNFCLEVQCIFRELTIKTPFHGHMLTLIEERSELIERICFHCSIPITRSPFLYCGLCKYSSHFRCGSPSTVRCSCHRHPLKFANSYRGDNSDELYCHACEERRNPKAPVYHCVECPYVGHIGCVIAKMWPDITKNQIGSNQKASEAGPA